jgi:hypothetical protein
MYVTRGTGMMQAANSMGTTHLFGVKKQLDNIAQVPLKHFNG